jgi:hypothetical protein
MNNEGRFHRNQDGKGTVVCLGEAERWPEEKELNTEITEFREQRKSSNKEIENEEEQADQKKYGAAIDTTGRQAAERVEKGIRDGSEAGFFADGVKRTGRCIAGEVAAENGNLILDPYGKFAASAPHECGSSQE